MDVGKCYAADGKLWTTSGAQRGHKLIQVNQLSFHFVGAHSSLSRFHKFLGMNHGVDAALGQHLLHLLHSFLGCASFGFKAHGVIQDTTSDSHKRPLQHPPIRTKQDLQEQTLPNDAKCLNEPFRLLSLFWQQAWLEFLSQNHSKNGSTPKLRKPMAQRELQATAWLRLPFGQSTTQLSVMWQYGVRDEATQDGMRVVHPKHHLRSSHLFGGKGKSSAETTSEIHTTFEGLMPCGFRRCHCDVVSADNLVNLLASNPHLPLDGIATQLFDNLHARDSRHVLVRPPDLLQKPEQCGVTSVQACFVLPRRIFHARLGGAASSSRWLHRIVRVWAAMANTFYWQVTKVTTQVRYHCQAP